MFRMISLIWLICVSAAMQLTSAPAFASARDGEKRDILREKELAALARKRMKNSSILENLRYCLAYPTSEHQEELLSRGASIFFEEAGGNEGLNRWHSLSKSEKSSILDLMLRATELLLPDTLSDSSNETACKNIALPVSDCGPAYSLNSPLEPDSRLWNIYFSLTDMLQNRQLDFFSHENKKKGDTNVCGFNESVDLFRLLAFEQAQEKMEKKAAYTLFEVSLDIIAVDARQMARHIHLKEKKTDQPNEQELIVDIINTILFEDLHIRFPPLSASEKYIDQFSNIEEVLISKRGVCLGVSAMYIAILQRVGIEPIIYTPPGHIFVAVASPQRVHGERIIETTARGIHLPLDSYLDSRIAAIPKRAVVEVVGMILTNDAARRIREKNFDRAYTLYSRAAQYLVKKEADFLTFWSFVALLTKKPEESKKLAQDALHNRPSYSLDGMPLAYDLAFGRMSLDHALILVDSMNADSEIEMAEASKKLDEICTSFEVSKLPITLIELQADVALKEMNTEKALEALEEMYNAWKKSENAHVWNGQRAPFLGLPSLVLLAEVQLNRSNIEKACFYVKEAADYLSKEKSRLSTPLCDSFTHPQELQLLILELSKRSPLSLKGINMNTL